MNHQSPKIIFHTDLFANVSNLYTPPLPPLSLYHQHKVYIHSAPFKASIVLVFSETSIWLFLCVIPKVDNIMIFFPQLNHLKAI